MFTLFSVLACSMPWRVCTVRGQGVRHAKETGFHPLEVSTPLEGFQLDRHTVLLVLYKDLSGRGRMNVRMDMRSREALWEGASLPGK